ncbi:MAG TPA: phosphatidate cytidylyltransferase [Anaerolineales bacterium]|nr:phosphatidate cytidylyltransferase [Anaerolineales bacterium]
MLYQRVLFTVFALPLGILFIFWGGWPYAVFIALILGRAAWEYADLFRNGGGSPSRWILVAGVLAIFFSRFAAGFAEDDWVFVLICAGTLTYYLFQYEGGRRRAASDFAASLSGVFYIGLLGSYMLLLRQDVPDGEWWLLLSLFAVMLADTSAYLVGSRCGRTRLAPTLSPKKSVEGYLAGVVAAGLGTPLFLFIFGQLGLPEVPAFSLANVALLGLALGTLPTLGDLGISMIKREMKRKDTSQILPGHGGVLDRIDSWLWAFPIGYYLVLFVFLNPK